MSDDATLFAALFEMARAASSDYVVPMALTAIGEARGDDRDGSSVEERIAVMSVIRNRFNSGAFGHSYAEVIFHPLQFSCWNPTDRNRAYLLNLWRKMRGEQAPTGDPVDTADRRLYGETLFLARGIAEGALVDRTGHALYYYAPAAMKPAGRVPESARRPDGSQKPYVTVGSQRFYL